MPALLLSLALVGQTPQTPVAPTPTQGPAILRWVPKEGDELKCRTVAELTFQGSPATLTTVNSLKVIRVDPDGGYTVQTKATESKVQMLGQEMQGNGLTIITDYYPTGEIKEIRGDRPEETGYRMANLNSFHAPTKAVAVGDAWTAEGKADAKTGSVGWKADYKVVGEEQIGPYGTLRIDVIARETEGAEAGKVTGSFWVARDGVVAKSELNWSNVATPGAPAAVSGKVTLVRLP